MAQPRLSTIYDFSDLRLHPDGTRVYQKSTNLRPDLVKVTTRDSRFNWIAKDAGGSATVPAFRKKAKAVDEREEDGEVDVLSPKDGNTEDSQQSSNESDGPQRNGKKRQLKRTDNRKAKRLKFINDYDYLDSGADPAVTVEDSPETGSVPANSIELPEPSADLLKCLHRFTSEFYTERGQLLNISREYRKERKKRALQRRAMRENTDSKPGDHEESIPPSTSDSKSPDLEPSTQDFDDDSDDEFSTQSEESSDSTDDDMKSNNEKAKGRAKRKRTKPWLRKPRRRTEKLYIDMYKMFDGSAMMALGMLVQEQIAHMLNPEVPEGWEEEMKRYYGDTGQNDSIEEEQSAEPMAPADGAASPEEDRGNGAEDKVAASHVASQKQSGSKVAKSRTKQSITKTPIHRFDDIPLPTHSSPGLSTAETNIESHLEHEAGDDEDDPIQTWSEDYENFEDSQGDID